MRLGRHCQKARDATKTLDPRLDLAKGNAAGDIEKIGEIKVHNVAGAKEAQKYLDNLQSGQAEKRVLLYEIDDVTGKTRYRSYGLEEIKTINTKLADLRKAKVVKGLKMAGKTLGVAGKVAGVTMVLIAPEEALAEYTGIPPTAWDILEPGFNPEGAANWILIGMGLKTRIDDPVLFESSPGMRAEASVGGPLRIGERVYTIGSMWKLDNETVGVKVEGYEYVFPFKRANPVAADPNLTAP